MRGQVLAFLRPVRRQSDWTREELAELYRIQNALVQARLMVEVDRGLTDEGDPWFVFCRPDGDVLVNISRIDGDYYLHSSALPGQMCAKSFQDLAKAFVDQIPIQVPVNRRNGTQLFVHPAAMLSVLIGTIFFAWDDTSHAFNRKASAEDISDSADIVDRAGFKAAFQAAFHSYVDSFLSGIRDASPVQHSAFLALISTVAAAFALGPAALLDDFSHEIAKFAHIFDDDQSVAPVVAEHTSQDDANDAQMAPLVGKLALNAAAVHAPAEASHTDLPQDSEPGLFATTNPTGEKTDHADSSSQNVKDMEVARNMSGPDDLSSADHTKPEDRAADAAANQLHLAHGSSDAAAAENAAAVLADATKSTGSPAAPQGEHFEVDQFFQSVKVGSPALTVTSTDQSALAFFVAEHPAGLAAGSNTDSSSSGTVTTNNLTLAVTTDLPSFDANAEAIINQFLKANPQAEAIIDHQNVIFYDGHHDLDSNGLTWQAWESDTGAMVAIIGHVDPTHSAIA